VFCFCCIFFLFTDLRALCLEEGKERNISKHSERGKKGQEGRLRFCSLCRLGQETSKPWWVGRNGKEEIAEWYTKKLI
jgi:hypothetical protein